MTGAFRCAALETAESIRMIGSCAQWIKAKPLDRLLGDPRSRDRTSGPRDAEVLPQMVDRGRQRVRVPVSLAGNSSMA
jgi:hypothetical protein